MPPHVFVSLEHTYHDPSKSSQAHKGAPEKPERVRWILKGLKLSGILTTFIGPDSFTELMLTAFSTVYKNANMDSLDDVMPPQLPETYINVDGTWRAVKNAIITACFSVDAAMSSKRPAFAIVRPPGHHAFKQARGFCWRNNTLVAAVYSTLKSGIDAVLIVDVDLHYGGGTELALRSGHLRKFMKKYKKTIKYVSMHHDGAYDDPATAYLCKAKAVEAGITRLVSSDDLHINDEMKITRRLSSNLNKIGKLVKEYNIDCIVVGAGFDHFSGEDMVGARRILWSIQNIRELAESLATMARDTKLGALVSVLEGGYKKHTMKFAVPAYIQATLATNRS